MKFTKAEQKQVNRLSPTRDSGLTDEQRRFVGQWMSKHSVEMILTSFNGGDDQGMCETPQLFWADGKTCTLYELFQDDDDEQRETAYKFEQILSIPLAQHFGSWGDMPLIAGSLSWRKNEYDKAEVVVSFKQLPEGDYDGEYIHHATPEKE